MTTPHTIDLTASHLTRREDGVFVVPPGSIVTFEPIGQFIEMKISVKGRTAASAVLHKSALKISRESGVVAEMLRLSVDEPWPQFGERK